MSSITTDLKERYESLYKEMVDSKDTKNMMLFGSVMSDMMERAIQRDTSFAQQAIDKLESMNWHQYLTKNEAETICENLDSCEWSFDTWKNALDSLELETERKPDFNKYALWILMNVMHSMHSETLSQKILEIVAEDITDEQMIQIIHGLAVDLLTKKEDKYNIRKFFVH